MIRPRLPIPGNGWPSFLTELVIVFLGVLIALAAQQTVDDVKVRREVADFRRAVNVELAENLSAYEQRVRQSRCANQRLNQLEAWQRDWRDGAGPKMVGRIRRPIGMTLRRDVWDTGAMSIVGDMPLDHRLAYAALYSALATYDNLRLREAAVWQSLYAFDQATQLSPSEVNTLRGLILSARSLDWSIAGNWTQLRTDAASMAVTPERYTVEPLTRKICEPIAFEPPLALLAAERR